MNKIEKLYKNAGVAKIGIRKCTTCEYLDCQNYCFVSENNKCDKFSYQYPPFTTEKQLEIIKLISKQGQVIIENWEKDNKGFNVTFRANSNLRYITMDCITRKTVEEALAQIVNDIWQDLTPEEKQQVKGILE